MGPFNCQFDEVEIKSLFAAFCSIDLYLPLKVTFPVNYFKLNHYFSYKFKSVRMYFSVLHGCMRKNNNDINILGRSHIIKQHSI